jgi:hypothetical protein
MLLCIVWLNTMSCRVRQIVEPNIWRKSGMKTVRRVRNGMTICDHVLYNMWYFHLIPPPVIARKGWYADSYYMHVYFKLSNFPALPCMQIVGVLITLKWKFTVCCFFVFSFCSPNPKRIISKCICNNQVGKHLHCLCCGGTCFDFWIGHCFFFFFIILYSCLNQILGFYLYCIVPNPL